MPEVNNIPPSLSYRPADPAEPVLDISIGDALRAATSNVADPHGPDRRKLRRSRRVADGRSRSLLTETEKVARGHCCLRFVSGEHVAIWAANWPGMGDD